MRKPAPMDRLHPPRRAPALPLLLLIPLLAGGCGGRFQPNIANPDDATPTGPPTGVDSQLDLPHPLFAGIDNMLAGNGEIWITWKPATDDKTPSEQIVYHVHLAQEAGTFDYTTPSIVTEPGATMVHLTGLQNAAVVHAVVRAVDDDPVPNIDPNEAEWAALPNPVRFVDPNGPAFGDGLTPATAYSNATLAMIGGFPLTGVNYWLAEGEYTQAADRWGFVYPGRSIYGGFDPTFDPLQRDPANRITKIQPDNIDAPLVVILNPPTPPSTVAVIPSALTVIDGLSLESRAVDIGGGLVTYPAFSGVRVQDAVARISNCSMIHFVSKGIDMTGDYLGSGQPITVTVRNCSIEEIDGEGIAIDGHTPTMIIDNCTVRNVANEAIEAQWIHADSNTSARIEITRCVIENTGVLDEGIDLDFDEEDPTSPGGSFGARIRALIRNNRIINAGVAGVNLDLDFDNSDGLDFRGRVEDNEIRDCVGDGVNLDGDARGTFRVARNAICGNGGAGIRMTGALGGPYARLLHNRIVGNALGGVLATGAITGEVRHQLFQGNRGPALTLDGAVLTVEDSILLANAGVSNPTRIGWSIVHEEPAPANGVGLILEDPGLESRPLFLRAATGAGGGGTVPLAGGTAGFFVGDTVELRDDGVPRTIDSVSPGAIVVSPPTSVSAGDLVSAWGSSTTVDEAEGLLVGSPAIDGGNPLERDRDGTIADIGPIGGNTPGNVGVETSVPEESAPLELVAVDPGPAEITTGSAWTFSFNRDLVPEVAETITIGRDGVDLRPEATITLGNRTITVGLPATPLLPGDTIDIGLLPGEFPLPDTEALLQPAVIEFPCRIGLAVADLDPLAPEQNGSLGAAQEIEALPAAVDGALGFFGDVDIFAVPLAAGQTLRVELFMTQIESLLRGKVTLLLGSGAVVSSASTDPLFLFDPRLPPYTASAAETVFVRVETSDPVLGPVGNYRLILR